MTTRRSFLKNSAILSSALIFNDKFVFENKIADIGLQTYTVRKIINNNNVAEVIQKVAAIGYKQLEIPAYNSSGKYWGMSPVDFRNLLDANGLSAPSAHIGLPQLVSNDGTDTLLKACGAGITAGNKFLTLAYLEPNVRKSADDYERLAQQLNTAGEICKREGLQLCYHNHDFEFIELPGNKKGFDILLRNTGKDLVKFELDLYWATKAGLDPVKLFENDPGRFVMWHVKDLDKNTQTFTEVGTGIVDFKKIFANQELSGVQYIFIEQDEISKNVFESIEQSFNYVKKQLL